MNYRQTHMHVSPPPTCTNTQSRTHTRTHTHTHTHTHARTHARTYPTPPPPTHTHAHICPQLPTWCESPIIRSCPDVHTSLIALVNKVVHKDIEVLDTSRSIIPTKCGVICKTFHTVCLTKPRHSYTDTFLIRVSVRGSIIL